MDIKQHQTVITDRREEYKFYKFSQIPAGWEFSGTGKENPGGSWWSSRVVETVTNLGRTIGYISQECVSEKKEFQS